MEFSQLFRSLKPDQLQLVVGEFGHEPGYYDGLIEYEAPGLEARFTPSGMAASLKAEIIKAGNTNASSPKERIFETTNGSINDEVVFDDCSETNQQLDGFTACLMHFQLPITPDAPFNSVGRAFDSILPRIATTKQQAGYRKLVGLTDQAVAVCCIFTNNSLSSFEIIDLFQRIACERFEGVPQDLVISERKTALERLKEDPEEAFFQYLGQLNSESIEWCRGFESISDDPDFDAEEQADPSAEPFHPEEVMPEEWLPS